MNYELRGANTRVNPCVIECDDIHQFNNHQIHLAVELLTSLRLYAGFCVTLRLTLRPLR
ncbi:MAG: hypothetical protein FMNOHCHN_00012 [Ignavibacteriaceae bacterium]|nr:hypothetical protein [Ignavibacteriaceae bacterium]